MTNKSAFRPLTVALGTVFTVSLANTGITHAADNPFAMQPLAAGYMQLAEGKCGEGKCGAGMSAQSKSDEGKCGEGRCGLNRMDADGDGKVTRDEFMQGHESMFDKIDANADGAIDATERDEHMKKMMGFLKEGKCGEGKCGAK